MVNSLLFSLGLIFILYWFTSFLVILHVLSKLKYCHMCKSTSDEIRKCKLWQYQSTTSLDLNPGIGLLQFKTVVVTVQIARKDLSVMRCIPRETRNVLREMRQVWWDRGNLLLGGTVLKPGPPEWQYITNRLLLTAENIAAICRKLYWNQTVNFNLQIAYCKCKTILWKMQIFEQLIPRLIYFKMPGLLCAVYPQSAVYVLHWPTPYRKWAYYCLNNFFSAHKRND